MKEHSLAFGPNSGLIGTICLPDSPQKCGVGVVLFNSGVVHRIGPHRFNVRLARKLAAHLLTETMERRPDIGLDSYDRFFPNQDTLPQGGFGNLIALPLQKRCRDAGTTVFVDPQTFTAYPDQWAYLATVVRLDAATLAQLVTEVRPVAVGPDARLMRSTLRREPDPPAVVPPLPSSGTGVGTRRSSAYPQQVLAKRSLDSSLLYWPSSMPGPLNSQTVFRSSPQISSAVQEPLALNSAAL